MAGDPETDLPKLLKHVERMSILVNATLARRPEYEDTDHYGFMLLAFFSKQGEHLQSASQLVSAGQHRDATIIARVMLEGLCLLFWCANEPEERPLQWRAYCLVSDWNLLQKRKADGEIIQPGVEENLRERLERHGFRYHTKKARASGPDGLENPYEKTWMLDESGSHIPRGRIFEEIRGAALYPVYEDFSQWIHWTPSGFSETISPTDSGMLYSTSAHAKGAQALAVAFQAVYQTAELVFSHFNFNSTPPLQDLLKDDLSELEIEI